VTPTSRDTRLWHPFADMAAVRGAEVVIERGEGVWVFDTEGRRYLDGTAALWYSNVGHGRKEIAEAIAAQLSRLEAYSIFGDLANPPALELADRLAGLAPMPDPRVFLVTGGGEAIETATKLSRLYWHTQGKPERVHVVSRVHAYHGSYGFGTSLGGIEPNRAGFGPLLPSTTRVPHDSVEALEQALVELGPENVAAFVFEPVIGAGGVHPPAPGYVEGVYEACASLGVLVVVDSTICGFGRLGTWFGFERFGIEPDMVIFAKGVTSGYLPLGGVVVSGRVAEPFWSEPGRIAFRHGPTYSGHATCCAAALANIDILEREGLIPRGRELEGDLYGALAPLAEHPLVAEVRGGVGLMAAVELDAGLLAADPTAPVALYRAIRDTGGVLVRPLGRGVALSPPLTITVEEIGLLAQGVRAGLDRLLETAPAAQERAVAARA
jgi:adenosylmethionine-8-amino-7-oxononanoate aminotransferase